MLEISFVHLRVHSLYSLGEASLTIKKLATLAKEYNMPALAITDSNNMFGVREFSSAMAEGGIKPIIGIEISVSYNLEDLTTHKQQENIIASSGQTLKSTLTNTVSKRGFKAGLNNFNNSNIVAPLVLLAKNQIGYLNLLQLHKELYINRKSGEDLNISLATLCKYSSDLIVLSGGNEGFLAKVMLQNNQNLTTAVLQKLKAAFLDNFYIEINRFPNQSGNYLENNFLELASQYNLPIVATANAHFAATPDFDANDILMCIGAGVTVSELERRRLAKEQYFKSQLEMASLFSDLPEALENTIKIAQKCNFLVEESPPSLPLYQEGTDEVTVLKQKSLEGLKLKLSHFLQSKKQQNLTKEEQQKLEQDYQERLLFEIEVIAKMNFAGYFLIVADFINWAKDNDIPVGPGRGSGAGSLVAWALNITDINPLQFGLFFERFLNPERISMPDFDIDFCQKRRDEVINYVVDKYGSDRVAQIITFGSLQTRAALRDVGRALGLPYASVDKICKRIPYSTPSNPITIAKVLKEEKELKEDIDTHYTLNQLFAIAQRLENLYRNTSTHAAGLVISLKPLAEVVPLYKDDSSSNSLPAVGFSMKYVEEVGLVKFDFLGLKTLTVIKDTVKSIAAVENTAIDIASIALKNDEEIAKLLSSGKTLGIFQLESLGMRDVLVQLKPDKIEDIIAIISLYRPGPMENIPSYINRKHGVEKVVNLHPLMDDILAETFGIMIYQEQVMQIAGKLAGYTLGEADLLRRAMGKKKPKEMAQQKSKFVAGALKNNINEELASKIFEQMAKFAGYGFNKSHAAAYAVISWQTAYLKAYYPAEFIAASMTYDMQDVDKLAILIEDAKEFNIKVLPPDINYADSVFVPFKDDKGGLFIRYSILAAKGTSKVLIEQVKGELAKNGKFKSIEDFLTRMPSTYLNKKQLEALIKSGSLDSLDPNRGKLLQQVEALLEFNNEVFKGGSSSQEISLFDGLGLEKSIKLQLKDIADMPSLEKLVEEAAVLGFFISGHPLAATESYFDKLSIIKYQTLIAEEKENANLAVVILKTKIAKTRRNDRYMTLSCSDVASTFNIILFGKSFEKFGNKVQQGGIYQIKVTARFDGTEAKLFVEDLQEFDIANIASKGLNREDNTTPAKEFALEITVNADKSLLYQLQETLKAARKGSTLVLLNIVFQNGEQQSLKLNTRVAYTDDLVSIIKRFAKISYVEL